MANEVKNEGKIDKEVLDILSQDDINAALSDDKQLKRVVMNCFCEFLSEIKALRVQFEEFSQIISVCSADKLSSFFKEIQKM